MKQHLSVCLFCALMTSVALNGEERTMIVSHGNQDPAKLPVTAGTRITFSDDLSKMFVSSAEQAEAASFSIADIDSITFSLESGVDAAIGDPSDLQILNRGGIVTVTAPGAVEFSAWDASGRQVIAGRAEQCATLDFTSKPAGVYILRINSTTVKFINR